jgi:ABC-type transport system involved in Fe-S cluster assembly fused permease/ATPase subunit
MVALFRLVEPCGGSIIIDGIATKDIGLKRLRQALAMIPQEAVLIEGSAAENLDPFGEHSTSELYAVLSKVGLPPSMLEQQVGTGGESLSVGERQLLAISRVLLRKVTLHHASILGRARAISLFVVVLSSSSLLKSAPPTPHPWPHPWRTGRIPPADGFNASRALC